MELDCITGVLLPYGLTEARRCSSHVPAWRRRRLCNCAEAFSKHHQGGRGSHRQSAGHVFPPQSLYGRLSFPPVSDHLVVSFAGGGLGFLLGCFLRGRLGYQSREWCGLSLRAIPACLAPTGLAQHSYPSRPASPLAELTCRAAQRVPPWAWQSGEGCRARLPSPLAGLCAPLRLLAHLGGLPELDLKTGLSWMEVCRAFPSRQALAR